MRRTSCVIAFCLVSAVFLWACNDRLVAATGPDGAPDADAGLFDAGAPDAGAGGFDPAPYCGIPAGASAEAPGLIPLPTVVHYFGQAALRDGTWSHDGASEDEIFEFQAFAEKGLTESDGRGALHAVMHGPERWSSIAAACGLDAAPPEGTYYLFMREEAAAVRAEVFSPDDLGRIYAIRTLGQLVRETGENGAATGVAIVFDRPASPIRGVIEGFYGNAWTEEARLQMLSHLADLKMNFFVYAPKSDLWITVLWDKDFPVDEVMHIRDVAREAKRRRIKACWELHPGLGIMFSSQEHFDALLNKYRVIAAQGIDCFILAFDDVPRELHGGDPAVYASYIEGQVEFSNRVADALASEYPGSFLGFVPLDYYTGAEGARTDLAYLGAHLDQRWAVGWTGPQIISKAITAADADEITGIIGRPPFLGDNYPVSDSPDATGVVNLGPLVGREPGLGSRVLGFIFNAMPFPYASLSGLATSADFAWNPSAYDPKRSIRAAAAVLAGEAGAAGFETLCMSNRSTILERSAAPELDAAIAAFWSAWDAGGAVRDEAGLLKSDFLEPFAAIDRLAATGAAAAIYAEIPQWPDKLALYGRAGSAAVDLLLEFRDSGSADPEAVASVRVDFAAASHLFAKPTGASMDGFLQRALKILEKR